MQHPVFNLLESPANWCGLGLGVLCLAASGAQATPFSGGIAAIGVTGVGYAVGFLLGCLVFGLPRLRRGADSMPTSSVQGDAKRQMMASLASIRQTVHLNTQKRLPKELRGKVLTLCTQIEQLLAQWEASKSDLGFEDGFHARHIAVKYLPEALQTYLSIPRRFATTEPLANGKTARETFESTLQDLGGKVRELKDSLAHQEAQSLLDHSSFLNRKFKS